jgi:hypothetical protein
MLLQFKGRMGYIKEWLLEKGNEHPEFLDLFRDLDSYPAYFRSTFDQEEEQIQKFDTPELKKIKFELQEQTKKFKNLKKEIEKLNDSLSQVKAITSETDEKMAELALLVGSKVQIVKQNLALDT